MPRPDTVKATLYLDLANEEMDRIYREHLPKGPSTVDMTMATLLYRAAEMNMKMTELLRTENAR
jgi:hypothetical protein